jgi:hypothetical protein
VRCCYGRVVCFSAQADLAGGLLIGAIGIDVIRHVDKRSEYRALAALPIVLAGHQMVEAFVWWGLQGRFSAYVGRVSTWIYLLFAFVILPIYLPAAIFLLEPPGRRRRIIAAFIALGAVVSTLLFAAILRGPVTASLGQFHIAYSTDLRAGGLVVAAYVTATCGSLIFSGYRTVATFGWINLVAVAFLSQATLNGFASLWCAWAAITSGLFAVQFRFGRPHRSSGFASLRLSRRV